MFPAGQPAVAVAAVEHLEALFVEALDAPHQQVESLVAFGIGQQLPQRDARLCQPLLGALQEFQAHQGAPQQPFGGDAVFGSALS